MKLEIIKKNSREQYFIRRTTAFFFRTYMDNCSITTWWYSKLYVEENAGYSDLDDAIAQYNKAKAYYADQLLPFTHRLFRKKYIVLNEQDIAARILGYNEN